MGIPTAAGADKEHAVAGVFDDVAAITKAERKGLALGRRFGKKDAEGIVAAREELFLGEAFILEEGDGFAGIERDGVNFEGAGKLDGDELFGAGEGAKIHGGVAVERVVWMDGGGDVVAEDVEGRRRRNEIGEGIGDPLVVDDGFCDGARLAQHEIFFVEVVEKNVEGAGNGAIEAGVEEMARGQGILFKENAKRVSGAEALEVGLPEVGEVLVGSGLDVGAMEIGEERWRGVVCKADVGGEK